jgi:acetyl-CoA carboxylase biotin carboxyl carrier protein
MKKKPATTAAAAPSLDEQIEALATLLRRHDLNELEVEEVGRRIYLRRGGVVEAVAQAAAKPAPAPAPAPNPQPAASAATTDGNVSYITSPFVGTFYRSPGPDSAPFVDVGTSFRKGQVLCIVEAMKLMNEIESEISGSIVACLVENGHTVEYGEPLFKIKQA